MESCRDAIATEIDHCSQKESFKLEAYVVDGW
jgi:hypothetical protein